MFQKGLGNDIIKNLIKKLKNLRKSSGFYLHSFLHLHEKLMTELSNLAGCINKTI